MGSVTQQSPCSDDTPSPLGVTVTEECLSAFAARLCERAAACAPSWPPLPSLEERRLDRHPSRPPARPPACPAHACQPPAPPPRACAQGLKLSLGESGLSPAGRATAQQKLQRLCRDVIRSAASASSGGGGVRSEGGTGGASNPGPAAAACTVDNPLRDALCGTGWEHAVRAPLVVAALEVLGALQGDAFSAEAVGMFPSLARLACSNQQSVRQALYVLLAGEEFRQLVGRAAVAAM